MESDFPESNRGWGTTVVSLMDQTVGDVRPALLITLAGVGLILLMAAVNVANLLLARSVARQRELAVRAALGASRARLVLQSLTESVMLALAGAALSLLLVHWGVRSLVALAPIDIPRIVDVSPDRRALAVTLLAGVASGLMVGLLPAFSAGNQDAAHRGLGHPISRRCLRLRPLEGPGFWWLLTTCRYSGKSYSTSRSTLIREPSVGPSSTPGAGPMYRAMTALWGLSNASMKKSPRLLKRSGERPLLM